MTPLDLARLLEGRSNAEREAIVGRWLEAQGLAVVRHRFTLGGAHGENLAVDLGAGDRVLVLCAHHDAVPGSPGANDNAAAVGVLLHLLARGGGGIPAGLRVRCLFTACEELDYLGARAWVQDMGVAGLAGVLALELVGIGDSLVVWDVVAETPFLTQVRTALEGLGLRADADYHVVGRIPRFGSDHRAFAAAGVPAYGLTVVPGASARALRRFVFHPRRAALGFLLRPPAPFRTYHTRRDRSGTLEPGALAVTARALEAVITAVGGGVGLGGPPGGGVSHEPGSGVS